MCIYSFGEYVNLASCEVEGSISLSFFNNSMVYFQVVYFLIIMAFHIQLKGSNWGMFYQLYWIIWKI